MTQIPTAVAAILLLSSTLAFAQVTDKAPARDTLDPLAVAFPELARLVEDVAPIVKAIAREEAVRSATKGTKGRAQVKSTDRAKTHKLHSPAHDRGAIDVVNVTLEDAQAISLEAGKDFTVIYERPIRRTPGMHGPQTDIHTIYQSGRYIRTKPEPDRATANHIHIQPDFNKRLHRTAARLEAVKRRIEALKAMRQIPRAVPVGTPAPVATPPPTPTVPSIDVVDETPTPQGGKIYRPDTCCDRW